MKNDPIISSLINFLVPIIFLYGLFCFIEFFEIGFFGVIYSAIIFVSAFMILAVKSSIEEFFVALQFEYAAFFILLLSICYILAILLSVTDLLSM
jgi:hypothetical protein